MSPRGYAVLVSRPNGGRPLRLAFLSARMDPATLAEKMKGWYGGYVVGRKYRSAWLTRTEADALAAGLTEHGMPAKVVPW